MSSDEFESSDSNPDDETFGNSEARPAVFVTTREPVNLTVSQLDDERAKGSSALAAYIDGRLVARSVMPLEAIARLVGLHLFDEPVRLGLFAYEESPGLQCRLFALVPRTSIEAEAHASEPWKASVPSYEALPEQDEDEDDLDDDDGGDDDDDAEMPFETILLGNIVRFERDRRYPDSLADEAVDILQRIIHGSESLEDADRKAIDDLLGSL
jgi:hypothetical protein